MCDIESGMAPHLTLAPDTAGVAGGAQMGAGAGVRPEVAAVLRAAAEVLDSHASPADVLRAAQAARDAMDAVRVEALSALAQTRGFEDEGASSVTTWARRELRLDPGETSALRRAGTVAAVLPRAGRAAAAGELRVEHLTALAFGIKHLGAGPMAAAEEVLVDHARVREPGAVLRLVRRLRAEVYPDALDAAWVRGMDREDLQLTAVGDGFHVTGFLSAATGAALRTVLDSLSTPRVEGDVRPPAARRVEGLATLLGSVLDAGVLPADRGVRPHLSVTVPAHGPATLSGFGPIGPKLAGYLACLGDLTPVVTATADAESGVLDVGRTRRVATLRQRRAVAAHQDGVCAAPGCGLPVTEIHHVTWWSAGGRTDLANLIGLCGPCHRLVHRGRLHIDITTTHHTTDRGSGNADADRGSGRFPHVHPGHPHRFTDRHGRPLHQPPDRRPPGGRSAARPPIPHPRE